MAKLNSENGKLCVWLDWPQNYSAEFRTISHLVSVAHEMVESDETLEDDDPVGAQGSLQKKVSQSRDGDIRLFRAVKKIWKRIFWKLLLVSSFKDDTEFYHLE